MKRIGAVISLVLLITLLATSFCFAGELELEKTYPVDGYKNAAVNNFGIKLFFNEDVANAANKLGNASCFSLTAADGTKIPTKVVYSEEDKGLVLVLADIDKKSELQLTESTEYTLKISENFVASNGDTLGEEKAITVTTLNQKRATTMNMLLMGVMCVVMIFFSTKSAKKAAEKATEEKAKAKDQKVNPYKVARETGKSVEDIIAKEEKKKAKEAAAAAKIAAQRAAYGITDEPEKEVVDNGNYKVKGPRPISAGGSTYKTGRKAAQEKAVAEARAKGTTNPKNKKKKK